MYQNNKRVLPPLHEIVTEYACDLEITYVELHN